MNKNSREDEEARKAQPGGIDPVDDIEIDVDDLDQGDEESGGKRAGEADAEGEMSAPGGHPAGATEPNRRSGR